MHQNESIRQQRRCRTEVYARVTGFMRPVQQWNKGKKVEFKERRTYRSSPGVRDNSEA